MVNRWLITETLLANLFYHSGENSKFTMEQLTLYAQFLISNIKEFFASDLCEVEVINCSERYPLLFRIEKDFNGKICTICAGKNCPNLDFFNLFYSKEICDSFSFYTEQFLKTLDCSVHKNTDIKSEQKQIKK